MKNKQKILDLVAEITKLLDEDIEIAKKVDPCSNYYDGKYLKLLGISILLGNLKENLIFKVK